ncbi:MAG: hypothetical protein AB8F78_18575 [Saprospiraceae bacterium]
MELLLSGFVILLLAQAKDPLFRWLEVIDANAGVDDLGEAIAIGANLLLPSAWLVLFSSLIFGVGLRALWISAIGLRSVSGEIELETLNLAPRFEKFLSRRVPAFDTYIARLENICSIVFGLTFLTVFALVGASVLALIFLLVLHTASSFLGLFYENSDDSKGAFLIIVFSFIAIFSSVVLVYVIDFFSGSKLKQNESFAKVYYPVYRFLGWLTLARIYRPLYYNFVDNKIGRYGILAIIPYGIVLLTLFQFNNSSFTSLLPGEGNYAFGSANFYADTHDGMSMSNPMISSNNIKGDHMELYFPMGSKYYRALEEACEKESESYEKLVYISTSDTKRFKRYTDFVDCINCAYTCIIDDTEINMPRGIIIQNPVNGESQFMTTINIGFLAPGGHVIRIEPNWETDRPWGYSETIPFIKR